MSPKPRQQVNIKVGSHWPERYTAKSPGQFSIGTNTTILEIQRHTFQEN
jgi:hypothetical protein